MHIAVENGHTQPLLMNLEAKEKDEDREEGEEEEYDDAKEVSKESQKPVTSIVMAFKLLTPSVKVRNS